MSHHSQWQNLPDDPAEGSRPGYLRCTALNGRARRKVSWSNVCDEFRKKQNNAMQKCHYGTGRHLLSMDRGCRVQKTRDSGWRLEEKEKLALFLPFDEQVFLPRNSASGLTCIELPFHVTRPRGALEGDFAISRESQVLGVLCTGKVKMRKWPLSNSSTTHLCREWPTLPFCTGGNGPLRNSGDQCFLKTQHQAPDFSTAAS